MMAWAPYQFRSEAVGTGVESGGYLPALKTIPGWKIGWTKAPSTPSIANRIRIGVEVENSRGASARPQNMSSYLFSRQEPPQHQHSQRPKVKRGVVENTNEAS